MTTQIKITQLVDIGANLATTTVLPVVNMSGVSTTQKTNLGNLGNVILAGAGSTWKPAALANLAYSVTNAAQPNITSVGTLSVNTLKISGGSSGQVLRTDGVGNLSWVNQSGGGGGSPGGVDTQVQFNDSGSFAGNTGFTFNKTTGIFTSPFVAGNGNGLSNIQGANVSGAVGLATFAGTANAVAGGNVSGQVSFANVANHVAAGNVTGLSNITTVTLNGSSSQVLYGNGIWATVGGGSANTGNIVFNNTDITANANTSATAVTIGFDTEGWAFAQFPSDATASTASTLLVNDAGNVVIQTGDFSTGSNSYAWTFTGAGLFTNPGNVLVNGQSLFVGEGSDQQGFTGETVVIYHEGEQYVQASLVNAADTGSADWVAYGHNGNDTGGWCDMGFTGSSFNDPGYSITGSGDGYIFVQGFQDNQTGGNFILATGSQGTTRDIIFATGGFATVNEFARISNANNSFELTSTGSTIKFPDGTIVGEVEGANTFGFYNENANIEFVLEAASNVWSFDGATGNLTLPGTLWAQASDNGSIVFSDNGTDINGSLKVDAGYNMVISANSNFYVKRAGSDRLAITDTNSDLMASSNVVIHANKAGTEKNWTFDTTGNLTFPTSAIIANISSFGPGLSTGMFDANGMTLGTGAGNDITFTPSDGVALYSNGAMWTFGTDGVTTNPVILFANLPSATTPGLRAFISDGNLAPIGNFGVEVSGGGGNYIPVFSDGANWCIG